MKELLDHEVDDVAGGALFAGAAIGAIGGGFSAWLNDGDLGDIVVGIAFGALGGFVGGAGSIIINAGSRASGSAVSATGLVITNLDPIVKKLNKKT